MGEEEFMYTMEMNDYKYAFEYDTLEEFKEQLDLVKATHKEVLEEESKYKKVNNAIDVRGQNTISESEKVSFAVLELSFVDHLKKENEENHTKLGKASYSAYSNTFNKLKTYFRDEDIREISLARFKAFRDYMLNEEKLGNKSTNGNMIYVAMFMEYAKDTLKIITTNEAKNIKPLKIEKVEKENFSKKDLDAIFDYDYAQYHKNIFKILAHSGMRIGELHGLTSDDIKQDENEIYYFYINEAKTENGNRKIPIHQDILEIVQGIDFPISSKTKNAFNKEMLTKLYKVIDEKSTKSLHTFRANFIGECINNYPSSIEAIQEISGHSQGSKGLTINTYAKGFKMKLKKEIVDSVRYV